MPRRPARFADDPRGNHVKKGDPLHSVEHRAVHATRAEPLAEKSSGVRAMWGEPLHAACRVIDESVTVRQLQKQGAAIAGKYRGLFVWACNGADRMKITVLVMAWALSVVSFWAWWLEPTHQVSPGRTACMFMMLFYSTIVFPLPPYLYLTCVRLGA